MILAISKDGTACGTLDLQPDGHTVSITDIGLLGILNGWMNDGVPVMAGGEKDGKYFTTVEFQKVGPGTAAAIEEQLDEAGYDVTITGGVQKLAKGSPDQARVEAGNPEGGEWTSGGGGGAAAAGQVGRSSKALKGSVRGHESNVAMGSAIGVMAANHMNPAVITAIGSVKMADKTPGEIKKQLAAGQEVAGMYTSSGGNLSIWLNPAKLEVEGGNTGTAIHEYGHHVYDRLTEGEAYKEIAGWSPKGFESAHEAANKEFAKADERSWKVETKNGHEYTIMRPGSAAKYGVTKGNEYSLSNLFEWHAEAFRAYHQGGENAKYMQKVAPKTYAFWDKVCKGGFK